MRGNSTIQVSIVVALSFMLPSASFAQSDPLTLTESLALRGVTAVEISPGGRNIAYQLAVPRELYVDADGPAYSELHVVNRDGDSTPYVTGKVNVGSVAWAGDGQSLYFVAKRDADAKVNSIYEISLAGGEARVVFTHSSDIGSIYPSPDGERIAFLASPPADADTEKLASLGFKAVVYEESVESTSVWILDVADGEATMHEHLGSVSDFAWSNDGRQYAMAKAPTPLIDDSYTSRDVFVVDASSGDIRASLGSVGKLGSFAFSPDNERIAYIGSVDVNDPSPGRLYVTSVSGGERREVVPNYAGHVMDFAWHDDGSIGWLGHSGLWSQWAYARLDDTAAAAPEVSAGPILRSVSAQHEMDVVAAVADSPSHPPEVYLLTGGSAPRRLTDSNPTLADRRLATQETISYLARDGLEIEAVVVRPFREMRGGNPLVVFVHGGPEAHFSNGWMSGYSIPAQAMAADGYMIAYPNYRGSTGRGVEFSKLDQHDYAEEEFNDLVDAKRHLVDAGDVDPERVGISGGSYGGYATMWSASALSEEYAAAVAFVGISNQISKFGTGDIPREMYFAHSLAWPWDDWMWMLERSPIFHAGKARTPLLIMGGDKDPRVHPSQSLEMYRNVKLRTDTPVRLVVYPGEVHGNRNTAARYDYALRFKRWMDHYLLGAGGEAPPYEIDHAAEMKRRADSASGL